MTCSPKKRAPVGVLEGGSVPRKRGPEAALKAKVIPMLENSGLVWWRNQSGMVRIMPQGGKGRPRPMRLGRPGLPDLMLLSRIGQLICVELKSPTGSLSADQVEFFEKVETLRQAWDDSLSYWDPYTGGPIKEVDITAPVNLFIVRTVEQMALVLTYAHNGTYPKMMTGRRKGIQYEPAV